MKTIWIFLALVNAGGEPHYVTSPMLSPQYAFTDRAQCDAAIRGHDMLRCVEFQVK